MPSTPETSREHLRHYYQKERERAVAKGREPITNTLLSLLMNRYDLRRISISEPLHRAEIAPFAMMEEHDGKERLIDYLLLREGLSSMIVADLKIAINRAFRDRAGVNAHESYELLLALLPFLRTANIWWFEWLQNDVSAQIAADGRRRQHDIAVPVENNTSPFLLTAVTESAWLTASVGGALFGCRSAEETVEECVRLYRRGVRAFVVKNELRQTITIENLFSLASLSKDDVRYRHLLS